MAPQWPRDVHAVAGDFRAAIRVFTNSGAVLSADPYNGINGNNFKQNLTDLRAEMRGQVGFLAPHALRIVDLTP